MFMLARGSVGTGAASQFDLALVEVLFEHEPLGFGDRPVLIRWPGLAAPARKSCGVKLAAWKPGCCSASSPQRRLSMFTTVVSEMTSCLVPILRWNKNGIGGLPRRSFGS